jgi:hypothetical protein
MAAKRRAAYAKAAPQPWPAALPQCPDPFTMYAAYPTSPLGENDRLSVTADAATIKMLWKHEINTFALDLMIAPDETSRLLNFISAQGTATIETIMRQHPAIDRNALWRTLAWLIKLGIVTRKA